MGTLTRDRTAEPVWRDEIFLRRERGQGKIIFPVELTMIRYVNLTCPADPNSVICDDYTYVHVIP